MSFLSKSVVPLLVLSVFAVGGCGRKAKIKQEKTVRVTVVKLKQQEFQERIPIKGTVQSRDTATLSAKIQGTLDDKKADEGLHFKKGELLFSIDRVTLENAVKVKTEEVSVAKTELSTAEIELKIAQTHARKGKLDLERAKRLIKGQAMAKTNYESAVVTWEATQAAVEKAGVAVKYRRAKLVQAETNLKIAQKELKDAMVLAPFDCLVTDILREQGEFVKTGENILKLENDKSLQLVCYLSAVYHRKIQVGKTMAEISVDGLVLGSAPVTYRAETIDPMTRTFKIKVILPPTINLNSGMLCNVDLILSRKTGWGIPESAVLQTGKRFFVFSATKENKARAILVKKGLVDRGRCQIMNYQYLKNERIIVSGQRFVNDGDKITVVK